MTNKLSLLEAVHDRYSVRKYGQQPVERELLDQLLDARRASLSDSEIRFLCVEAEKMRGYLETPLGKIFNAPTYIVMIAKDRGQFLLEVGYRGEQLILAATSLGLGTCWIGALFAEEKLRNGLGLDASWRMVAVSPLGYASSGTVDNAVGGLIRRAAGSHKRKPMREILFAESYGNPLDSFSGQYSRWEKIFNAVRVAPSWTNGQPWRFIICAESVYGVLIPARTKNKGLKISQIKSGMDYTLVDMGIAMAHFDIAREAGDIGGKWTIFAGDPEELKNKLKIPADHRLVGEFGSEK